MAEMTTESTVYVTYIASTPERVWDALTDPEAISSFTAAVEHKPNYAEAQFALGTALIAQNRVAEALS